MRMIPILAGVMQIIALLIIAATVYLIIKRFQTHATLFLAGFALLTTAHLAQVFSDGAASRESPT